MFDDRLLKCVTIILPFFMTAVLVLLGCQATSTNTSQNEANDQAIQITVLDTPTPTFTPIPSPTALPNTFLETFDGQPAHPEAWQPTTWDVTIHSRDRETWDELETMQADHGENCEPPPAQHEIRAYEESVFRCRDHLMTALLASGYGLIYLTPNSLVDFSQQEAIIRFDLSTQRRSPRDWVDLWITPYENHLQLPLDHTLPDLSGEPQRGIHIRMDFGQADENYSGNKFSGEVINEFEVEALPLNDIRDYEEVLTPDAKQRSTFELRLSQHHIKFGLPDHDLWWIDTEIQLDWAEGVVQLGHHSYNPLKNCVACAPNTWHWDNVLISPAKSFTILPADRRFVNEEGESVVNFAKPAPKHAHLRFAGIGNNLQFSIDHGKTWQPAQLQHYNETLAKDENFKSYWTPIPGGIRQVQLRGEAWWGGAWHVRDISIWSPNVE